MPQKKQPAWLRAALAYVPAYLGFQVERHRQTGCAVAIADAGGLVAEFAFGQANLRTGEAMTPRHRFRIASHSKSFTAAGVLLLREQGLLGLDDAIGDHVDGLHPGLAEARIGQLLQHAAGVTRDGDDSGQFADRRPYLSREELRAALAKAQPLEPGLQLKYSNHGYGLLGLLIEAVTGSDYAEWIADEIVSPAGLNETVPDMPALPRGARMACGHSMEFPFGQRLLVPGDAPCNAIAAAGGFVATAADVARFFAQLDPAAPRSVLSAASRREMQRRRWRDERSVVEVHYGLGTMASAPGPREWFGHTGSLQGFVSRTARCADLGLTITVLCNAQDGMSWAWADAIASILRAFREHGAPSKRAAAWRGRWWSMWGASDLVPMGKIVCQVAPAMQPPFDAATTELQPLSADTGRVARASAFNSPGESVRLVRDGRGRPQELWVGGSRMLPKEAMLAEVTGRYRASQPGRRKTAAKAKG